MPDGRIFISYRREGGFGFAHSIRDRLSQRFPGRVFMDLTDLDPGMPFREILARELATCQALIALIPKNPESFRRLQDPGDFVRMEIHATLERKIRIFPVLLEGLTPADLQQQHLPDDLAPIREYQTLSLRDEGFDDDLERLVRAVEKALDPASSSPQPHAPQPSQPPAPPAFIPPTLFEMYGVWVVAVQAPIPNPRFVNFTVMGFQIANGVIPTGQGAWRYDPNSGTLSMWGQSLEIGPFNLFLRFQGRQGNQYTAQGSDGMSYLFTRQG